MTGRVLHSDRRIVSEDDEETMKTVYDRLVRYRNVYTTTTNFGLRTIRMMGTVIEDK
jgi:hypothetical protein